MIRMSPLLRTLPLVALALPLVVLLGLPWPAALRWVEPDNTSFTLFRERSGVEVNGLGAGWVPYERIPGSLIAAVIDAEDGRFREHHGIDFHALADELEFPRYSFDWKSGRDWRDLAGALRYGAEHRSELRGRSTITQQLAKNLYYTPDRSFLRKVMEGLVAQRIEWGMDKRRILELYLNTVEMGPGLFGMGAAAEHYYGKELAQISNGQARALARTLPAPMTRNPGR